MRAGRRRALHSPTRLARAGVVGLLVVVAAGGCASGAGQDEEGSDLTPASPSGPDFSDAALWLSFEDTAVEYDGKTAYPDALGGPSAGRVVTFNGGAVESVPGPTDRGDAVAFPAKCTAPSGCQRAMVEILSRPALNPGERNFEYGASVWLASDQTTTGSNIVQKGRFGSEGGLWKLQVDSDAGEPSCVVRSGESMVISIVCSPSRSAVTPRPPDSCPMITANKPDRRVGL